MFVVCSVFVGVKHGFQHFKCHLVLKCLFFLKLNVSISCMMFL
jgi:hypothetical protein